MKIGMFTSGYIRNPLEHAFQDAKEYGYDYIELFGARPHAYAFDLKAGDIHMVRQLIDRYEVPVLGYCPEHNAYPYNYMIGPESQRQDAEDYLKLCLDMAAEMGADYMLTGPAHGGYLATRKELWERLVKTIRALGEHAAKVGVHLAVEPLTPFEGNVLTTANDLQELLDEINNPYVVGMCDTVPPYVQHESIMAYFDKLGSRMYHMHLIDGKSGTDDHIVPGEGTLPLRELLFELKRIGYERTATIEMVSNYINEPRFYARRAIDHIRMLMQEAGYEPKKN